MSFVYINFTYFSYLFEISYRILEYLYLLQSLYFFLRDKKFKKLCQYFLEWNHDCELIKKLNANRSKLFCSKKKFEEGCDFYHTFANFTIIV